jgi:hypothetical protein
MKTQFYNIGPNEKRFVIWCHKKPCQAVMFTPGLSETVGATSHQQYSIKDRCWNYWLYEAAYPKCQRLNIAWLQQLDVNRNTCSGFCGHTGMSKCTLDLQALVEMKILGGKNPPTPVQSEGSLPCLKELGLTVLWLLQYCPTRGPRTNPFWATSHTPVLALSIFFIIKSVTFYFFHCLYFCMFACGPPCLLC